MPIDYLKRILTARVYDVARETPLEAAPGLSERLGHRLLLKREDMQTVFSFKLRGAYNKMVRLSEEERARGVIAASAGNHAQGVALAAQHLGCHAVIVMPVTTPAVKIEAVRARQAQVVLAGDSYSDAYSHALSLQQKHGFSFVHPFDDPDVIAGQGTIGMEILRQHPDPIEAIFVAIGGGGLIAGIAAYVKQIRPEIKIIGVQTDDSNAMAQSLACGERVVLSEVGLFSDGTAVKQVGLETFALAQQFVDEVICVNTDAICAAIKDVFQDTRSIMEPAGALAIAGAKVWAERPDQAKHKTLVAIACGANMNFDRLRFVSERAEIGEQREAIFAVTIPEQRGSFKRFCALIGERNVTEFNYRMSDLKRAHVFVGIQIQARDEANAIASIFAQEGLETINLTDDEMAKLHIRHLVGGSSSHAKDERLFRFEFPERPGALSRFLTQMRPDWNISLFHYRNHGADFGRVLVGLQVPQADEAAFQHFLSGLGYPHLEETNNPAYHLFLRPNRP
ncbi:MAG: threonine ammonia-lyase, biosynthetic [Burkholderiales bacterium]|jgi:threonine dehydratase|nr:threonine ammonia-lyase, biosynthetic [Burkholderiaceae bacterium]MBU6286473.1 threonine ammonia-lyase, biosynthetic [Pseudomonadota bacterium]NBS82152.1 threonine ammonia-lyase, biosynthetic [Betaproteobacteria bacterium]NBT99535.1 threonine ammonia-lyase, biosynthetic [Betaproteobacteria bacterium]NCX03313.1 threonine ammonia-lyase, biosynthetic [Betaproteobacteria bacterium]